MSEAFAGPRVVVTRSPEQAPALAAQLAGYGFRPLLFPVIEFAPLPAPELDAALRQIDRYDWLIFTSANAVEFFCRRVGDLEPSRLPPVAVVGSATAAALANRGIAPAFTPSEFTGRALVAGLAAGLTGKRVLLPRARIGRPEIVQLLAARGAEVDDIALYDTVRASPPPDAFAELRRGFEAAVFTSPSSVRNFLALIEPYADIRSFLDQAIIACIGPVTAGAAGDAGLAVAVTPSGFTVEAVVEMLASSFALSRPCA